MSPTHKNHAHKHTPPHRIMIWAVSLLFIFAAIEAAAGWWAQSLALLSDAGHMASDGLALSIAAFASWIALKPPSQKHSYGLGRAEVVAAGISSILLLLISIVIIIEAVRRIHVPTEVHGKTVILVALVGLLVNVYVAWLLARSEPTLNIKAALLHVMSDILGSIAALVAGAIIYFTHWMMIDPILSILISILILISSLSLIRESLLILMEGVPGHINLKTVSDQMLRIEGVKAIHDFHIWTLSSGKVALSAHIYIHELSHWETILTNLRNLLKNKYDIDHITLQPEPEIIDCQPCAGT